MIIQIKRIIRIISIFVFVFIFAACGREYVDPHPDWPEDWIRLGDYLGVEMPEGFDFNDGKDVFAAVGLCYATWTSGEERDVINEDGDEAKAYDAQIYLLVKECDSVGRAKADVEAWMTREKSVYSAGEDRSESFAGQAFTLFSLDKARETNPYQKGYAAFALRENLILSVELLAKESFEGDLQQIMSDFLSGLHYE